MSIIYWNTSDLLAPWDQNSVLQGALSTLSPKDKPWDVHKLQSDEVSSLYALSVYPEYGVRINDCARRLCFQLKPDENDCLQFKLSTAFFCRVRHCPVCQWRRSLKWRARLFQALPKIQKDYPTAKFIFLTLTVKNCPLEELRETVSFLNKGFKRLSQLKVWPGLGWIKSLEVTRSKNGEAHPHFHCLLMVNSSYFAANYLKHEEWVKLWKRSLRLDYEPVVNVKLVKGDIHKSVCEVIKYSIKPSDIYSSVGWLEGLTKQLHKTQAIAVGGVFRSYFQEVDENEDLINIDDNLETDISKYPEVFFDWCKRHHLYLKNEAIT